MKYASDLCTLSNCPPIGCKSIKKEAFRFVFNPICEKSFTPQGKKNPQRVSKSTNNSERCSLLGLSMFESEDCAIKRYKYLKKMVKNINKTFIIYFNPFILPLEAMYREFFFPLFLYIYYECLFILLLIIVNFY